MSQTTNEPNDQIPNDHTEHRTGGRIVYEGRTLDLHVDDVRLPNGKGSKREVVRHKGSVCFVATQDGLVYLVRQFRYATGESLLELPAGTLDAGEEPEAAARREIEEEIGLAAERMTFLFEGFVSPGYTDELMRFYLAEGLTESRAEADDDEFIDIVTLTWPEALAEIDRGAFRDSKTVAGLLCAARKMGLR